MNTKSKIRRRTKTVNSLKKSINYEKDFCRWIDSQAELLKNRDLDKLDIDNLIEEIESLGRSDKRSLRSHTIVLLKHMLKQQYQAEQDCNSWKASISNARRGIRLLIKDSPSLKNELKIIFPEAYLDAVEEAAIETGLSVDTFPQECPWTIQEIIV